MKVEIKKPSKEELEKLGVFNWPIWEKEPSEFDWYYDSTEVCYFIEGKVVVETEDGSYTVEKGELVRFPAGLKCRWKVVERVRKHYNFE